MKASTDIIKVLVIDDETSIREGSERILKRMGCSVLGAANGEEGLAILARKRVHIVLLDLKMPGMDGMEVLGHIQADYPAILVIVITGFATVETAIEAMKQGAYDFIPKPFEPDQLRIVINRAKDKIQLQAEAEKLARDRRRTLADLDMEKSRIRTVIESLPSGLVVTNTEGNIVLVNPAFCHQIGLEPGQIILGKTLVEQLEVGTALDVAGEVFAVAFAHLLLGGDVGVHAQKAECLTAQHVHQQTCGGIRIVGLLFDQRPRAHDQRLRHVAFLDAVEQIAAGVVEDRFDGVPGQKEAKEDLCCHAPPLGVCEAGFEIRVAVGKNSLVQLAYVLVARVGCHGQHDVFERVGKRVEKGEHLVDQRLCRQ